MTLILLIISYLPIFGGLFYAAHGEALLAIICFLMDIPFAYPFTRLMAMMKAQKETGENQSWSFFIWFNTVVTIEVDETHTHYSIESFDIDDYE